MQLEDCRVIDKWEEGSRIQTNKERVRERVLLTGGESRGVNRWGELSRVLKRVAWEAHSSRRDCVRGWRGVEGEGRMALRPHHYWLCVRVPHPLTGKRGWGVHAVGVKHEVVYTGTYQCQVHTSTYLELVHTGIYLEWYVPVRTWNWYVPVRT